jgi:hypothetical protein
VLQHGRIGPVEPTARVFDDHDLHRAEELLADHERPDDVVRDQASGVPDDVRVTRPEAQGLFHVEPRIHAGDDGHAREWCGGQGGTVEGLRVALVLGEESGVLAGPRSVGRWFAVAGHPQAWVEPPDPEAGSDPP